MARGHPVRVARVEPERLLKQSRHRWEKAVPGEVEPVREPALADQKAHELLGGRDVPAVLEDHSLVNSSYDGERLALSVFVWPVDRDRVFGVVRTDYGKPALVGALQRPAP
jgi:hypothetical protein